METVTVINIPPERVQLTNFQWRPTCVLFAADPEADTRQRFGLPATEIVTDEAAKVPNNPTGELPTLAHIFEATNTMNKKDGFEHTEATTKSWPPPARSPAMNTSPFRKGFEFDVMSQRPMYRACPRWLVEHCQIGERSTVIDLGCGSGVLTQLLLEQFEQAPSFRVIAIDPSEWELAIARSRIFDTRVSFIQGRAQEAPGIVKTAVDAVLLCNVLHQVPVAERRPVLEGAFALVRAGGRVGANTLFYDGGVEATTRAFYVRWMSEARQSLARAGVSWRPPATLPVALQRLSPGQHHELFRALGYEDIEVEEVQFDWRVEDWEALSKYSVFIEGALTPGIDLEIGSQALVEGVRAAYHALGIKTVRRGWLHCAARRPA